MTVDSPIAVLGAGAWGTALALLLAKNGNQVTLWGHEPDQMRSLQNHRENKAFLLGHHFPDNLQPCIELESALSGVQDVLIVVPSQGFESCLTKIKRHIKHPRIAWGTKGLMPTSAEFFHDAVKRLFTDKTPHAVLSGPSFAAEVAADLPTAVSVAGNDSAFLDDLSHRLSNLNFRVYQNADIAGVQLLATLKNILAIAVGISEGMGLGANARCALITRSLIEIRSLCLALGAKAETLLSLAGIGDIILTCTDNQSRNRRFGVCIGEGASSDVAFNTIGKAVEGYQNVQQIVLLAERHHVDIPIIQEVYNILYHQKSPQSALSDLLKKPILPEV